jgi:hypothetical protein
LIEGEYEVKGIVKTDYLQKYNINKNFLYCLLRPITIEKILKIEILANQGRSKYPVSNYIEFIDKKMSIELNKNDIVVDSIE